VRRENDFKAEAEQLRQQLSSDRQHLQQRHETERAHIQCELESAREQKRKVCGYEAMLFSLDISKLIEMSYSRLDCRRKKPETKLIVREIN